MVNSQPLKMNDEILFAQNGYVAIPELETAGKANPSTLRLQSLGTIFSNLSHYGFILSLKATQKLMELDDKGLAAFWKRVEPALAYVSGADRNMAEFVVYKNFPKEVLEMSLAEYWTNQILMYWACQTISSPSLKKSVRHFRK